MKNEQKETSSFLLARKTLKRVVEDTRLPHTAIAIWATLLSFSNNTTGKCNPSHKTLMKLTQIKSKATLLKYLKLLRETGYILVDSGRQEHRSNLYVVKFFDDRQSASEKTEVGLNHCTPVDETPPPTVQSMNFTGANGCTEGVQQMNTELNSSNYTQTKSTKPPATASTPRKEVVPQQGRGESEDFEDPKAEELRKNPAFLEKLKSLSYHLGANVQGYEQAAMAQAKSVLAKYAHLFQDRPLHTTEVTAFLEGFYASMNWDAPTAEETKDLVDNLVSTMSYRQFKAACKGLQLTFQPHWKIPPTFQSFVKALKEGQGDSLEKLMSALKTNVGICEQRGYPSRATVRVYA